MGKDVPEGPTFPKLLKKCERCMNLRVTLYHTQPPTIDHNISWLTAEDNIQEVYCRAGRLRYRDGSEKRYKSKHAIRMKSDIDGECPDFDPDE